MDVIKTEIEYFEYEQEDSKHPIIKKEEYLDNDRKTNVSKPFHCKLCDKFYTDPSPLTRHMENKTPRKRF